MQLTRRRFFSVLAAPAIVSIANIMPVRALAFLAAPQPEALARFASRLWVSSAGVAGATGLSASDPMRSLADAMARIAPGGSIYMLPGHVEVVTTPISGPHVHIVGVAWPKQRPTVIHVRA